MEKHRSGASVAIILLVLVAGLIIGGIISSYVSLRRISSLENEISNLENLVSSFGIQISQISGNSTIFNQNITIYQNATALAEMYELVKDSVVMILGETSEGTVQGSGFIYNLTGSMVVVTNNHVVHDTTRLSVTFSDGHGFGCIVNGTDPYADLAVLSVVGASGDEFKPLDVANSSSLNVGDPVVAIGAPFGLAGSMTTGVISALGRTISEVEYTGGFAIANIIQTSAPINPGNSGGPLLNFDSKVVGITAAIINNSQGVGFAIPSNAIIREIVYLAQSGSYAGHSYLGVTGGDMDYFQAQDMHTDVTYGWRIATIVSGGPASNAGMHIDDVIVGINGYALINGDEMSGYLEEYTLPGQRVTMNLVRGTQRLDLPLILGTRPRPPT